MNHLEISLLAILFVVKFASGIGLQRAILTLTLANTRFQEGGEAQTDGLMDPEMNARVLQPRNLLALQILCCIFCCSQVLVG